MNLPTSYRRCRGRLGFDWQIDAPACERRDNCLRHLKLLEDEIYGRQIGEPMQQCVSEQAFLPLDAFEPKEEAA